MEIVDYLRAARRHIVLIVLVPLVAAGGAAAILFLQKPVYISTATVDPPALVGGPTSQYTGAQGVVQFVAAFQATASGPVVRNAVAKSAHVSTTDLADNLDVKQRGGSASVLVTYTSTDRNSVKPVAAAAATETLRRMFSSQVTEAQSRLQEAQAALRSANEAVGAFTAKVRMADPQKAYEAQLTRVNALAQQQASMQASGNAVGAAAMSAPIASANAALEKYGPILSEYNSLLQVRDTAATTLAASETQLANAKSQFDAADPSKIVFVTSAQPVDDTQIMMRTVVAVAAAAFFLALLIVAMLEVVARGRRERVADEAAAAAATSSETAAASPAAGRTSAPQRSRTPAPTAGHGVPARASHHR